jgi:hypothetical protein
VDTATLILGALPPGIAILAEIFNPVSKAVIKTHYDKPARDLVPYPDPPDEEPDTPDARYEQAKARYENTVADVSDAVAETASGAAEASALIPTWISFTAGAAAILINEIDRGIAIVLVIVWTLVWGLAGIKYFSALDYYRLAFHRHRLWIPELNVRLYSRNLRIPAFPSEPIMVDGDKLIRWFVIGLNSLVITVVLCVWKFGPNETKYVTSIATQLSRPNPIYGDFPDERITANIQALKFVKGEQQRSDQHIYPMEFQELSSGVQELKGGFSFFPMMQTHEQHKSTKRKHMSTVRKHSDHLTNQNATFHR